MVHIGQLCLLLRLDISRMLKVVNSIQKGKRGERQLAKALQSHGVAARRGQQFKGGDDSPDVIHEIPWVWFEHKFVERLSLYEAYAQAVRDAPANKMPVVSHKRKRKPILVILSLDDFMKLRLSLPYLLGEKPLNEHAKGVTK
jgi:hypothetical protein